VLRAAPRVCGVSLQTTEAMLATLTFTRLLRDRGYRGTIVVGGHVATLAADAILEAPAGVDVVVELAGEQALVGLARGDDPLSLPGAVTRRGRGPAPQAVAPQAMKRERLGEHLGFGAADLLLSRGCEAHCGYCCIAAVSDRAERRHVAREIESIADEIAELASRGARAFHFMDDNVLPLDPERALAWARDLAAALAVRRVPRIAFSLQLRADVVTPSVADALVELGLVRAYIGIDGYSAGQLRAIGRDAPASAGIAAIAELSRRGVFCVANALVIGPTIRLETIAGEIAGLAAVRDAPVHLLPIEARPGTVYHRRAVARGLIEGGPLWPIYRFEDPRAFLVGEVITGLPTRLAERSVPIALYDLAWGLGVARRLAPEARVDAAIATYRAVTDAWNADQVRVLRAAVDAAERGPDAIAALLDAERAYVRAHDDALLRACDDALVDVERAVSHIHHRPVRAHARGRWLGGVAVAMGLATACGSSGGAKSDAMVDVGIDAPWMCADSAHMPADPSYPDPSCMCGGAMMIKMTFDDHGVVTGITNANGDPMPANVAKSLHDLFAGYCYPSVAGTTQTYMTCHAWIA